MFGWYFQGMAQQAGLCLSIIALDLMRNLLTPQKFALDLIRNFLPECV